MASKAQCLAINIEIGLARNQMVQKQHVGMAVAMVVVWAAVVVQEATAMLAAIVSVVTKHDLASDATNLRLRILIEIPISTEARRRPVAGAPKQAFYVVDSVQAQM
jgi:hypothetical protein